MTKVFTFIQKIILIFEINVIYIPSIAIQVFFIIRLYKCIIRFINV